MWRRWGLFYLFVPSFPKDGDLNVFYLTLEFINVFIQPMQSTECRLWLSKPLQIELPGVIGHTLYSSPTPSKWSSYRFTVPISHHGGGSAWQKVLHILYIRRQAKQRGASFPGAVALCATCDAICRPDSTFTPPAVDLHH